MALCISLFFFSFGKSSSLPNERPFFGGHWTIVGSLVYLLTCMSLFSCRHLPPCPLLGGLGSELQADGGCPPHLFGVLAVHWEWCGQTDSGCHGRHSMGGQCGPVRLDSGGEWAWSHPNSPDQVRANYLEQKNMITSEGGTLT